MKSVKKFHILLLPVYLSVHITLCLCTPTQVYVRNCTPLRFDVSIDYDRITNTSDNYWQKGTETIAPFDMPEEKNIVLSINRQLPEGEHNYTIKLSHGAEILYLKQKFISNSHDKNSEFGISIESICLQDPWFMNNQAKEKHEHLLSINGHTIVVVYYAYETDISKNIEYTLYEKFDLPKEITQQLNICGKCLTYSLAIPITLLSKDYAHSSILIKTLPKPLRFLAKTFFSSRRLFSKYRQNSISSQIDQYSMKIDEQHIVESEDVNNKSQKKLDGRWLLVTQSKFNDSHEEDLISMQSNSVTGQKIMNFIAQKKSWYSGYAVSDSKTMQFWVPRSKVTQSCK